MNQALAPTTVLTSWVKRCTAQMPDLGSQELFKTMTGTRMTHVPYKGTAKKLTALIAGEVQMSCIQVQVALQQARAGRVTALAMTSGQRLPVAPDIPTVAESDVPGFEAVSRQGVVLPAGKPRVIVSWFFTCQKARSLDRGPGFQGTVFLLPACSVC